MPETLDWNGMVQKEAFQTLMQEVYQFFTWPIEQKEIRLVDFSEFREEN